jgi:hypothetical protein
MLARTVFVTAVASLLSACADETPMSAWDQLDSRFRADCAPNGEEAVLHAWKGGKRYCFRYTIERVRPREGSAVVIARADSLQTN